MLPVVVDRGLERVAHLSITEVRWTMYPQSAADAFDRNER